MGDSFSTVVGIQYVGGYLQYMQGDNISTVGDNVSTVEGIQYGGGYFQYSEGLASVLWRAFSTVEIKI